MSLHSGYHFIYDIRGKPIALPVETSSNPRAVLRHIKDVPPIFAVWNIEQGSEPDTYILFNRGSYTSPTDGLVCAVLTEGKPPAEEWVIEPAPGYPPDSNKYMYVDHVIFEPELSVKRQTLISILTNNRESAWMVAEGKKEAQVESRSSCLASVFQILCTPLPG
ncbi:hypothetical protein E1B28_011936 [Marasmius oreades]|uniref:Uncharacterized protein n=1 Tax=Marasmius oreades TaxID=181124 RepID=A0A9P7UQ98_9AGAR|nr:uncharacterized protein E1B28_011936 [Marasmius oreades]KAG7087889.1 hypothetical protein E1B28_011936 [Marasmius oreades]